MTPPYSTNSSSSSLPFELNNEDHDHQNHTLNFSTPNYHVASSTSHSRLSHPFLNSTWDQSQYYHSARQFYYPQRHKVDNHATNGKGSYDQGPKTKVTLWKNSKENYEDNNDCAHEIIPVNWMSSKMRVMQKMKSSDRAATEAAMASVTTTTATTTATKIEDQKRPSSSLESEYCSNSSSNHSSSNVPIRVCADCNTTKTPLWRSGPKGPKSLCNACGIRQRKARRAMVAAAAAANCTAAALTTEASSPSSLKNKVKPTKEKMAAKNNSVKHHRVTPFKKRCKIVATTARQPPHQAKKKINGFEDFLIKLSNNLAYHRVFPQDEKDAAILLMALSCGLVHS